MAHDVLQLYLPGEAQRALANLGAEQGLLGALIMKPALLIHVTAAFHPEQLCFQWHADIYAAVLAHGDLPGDATQVVIQTWALGDRDKIAYVATLFQAAVGYQKGLITAHCEIITDLWRRRSVVQLADRLRGEAHHANASISSTGYISTAISQLDIIRSAAPSGRPAVTMSQAVDEAIAAGERAANGEVTGTSTGFPSIDKAIGNLEPGCLYVLAGRPGMGKTALGLQIGVNLAQAGHGVLICSLEMQATQLGRRTLAYLSGVSSYALKAGRWTPDQGLAIARARKAVFDCPLTIEDEPGQNTAMIAIKARDAKRRHGLNVIIVDHLHIVAADAAANRMGETWAVGKVSNDLKRLAKEMDVAIIALAQLNRGVEARDDKRPGMADLRQSGNIEQDADAILFLYRAEYYLAKSEPEQGEHMTAEVHAKRVDEWHAMRQRSAGKAELICAKVRDGDTGTVPLSWDAGRTSFGELIA